MKGSLIHSYWMGYSILKTNILKRPQILSMQIMLNYTCNQRCLYCSVSHTDEIMEFSRIKYILVYLKRMGTLQVSFAGGEPTIHPDYQEIIRLSKSLGFYTTVSTNGIDNTPLLDAHKDAIPHLVSISLDGPRDVHDIYRGKGTWEKACATLNALKEYNIPRAINAVIGKHNCNLDTIRWLFAKAEELNANFNFQWMLPRVYSDDSQNPFAPDIAEIKRLIEGILLMPLRKRRRGILGDDVLKQLMTWDSLVPYYRTKQGKRCFAGTNYAFISPSYVLTPCPLLEYYPWYRTNDLFKVGFEKAFEAIKDIPCNDCYLGCNILRNNIIGLNPRIFKGILRMVFNI